MHTFCCLQGWRLGVAGLEVTQGRLLWPGELDRQRMLQGCPKGKAGWQAVGLPLVHLQDAPARS